MGRKSKSDEKRQVILDAFESVIMREGYANASQRKIAEEAGVNQPMIHHYFSGGDELLSALLERITERYHVALSEFKRTDDNPTLEHILDFLCSEPFHQVSLQNEVMFRLIGQSRHHQSTIDLLSDIYREFHDEMKDYLQQANIENVDRTAYTLMCIVIGHDWAKTLGFGENRNQLMTETLIKLAR